MCHANKLTPKHVETVKIVAVPKFELYSLYTAELNEVFDQYQLNHHCFADDTQAYIDVPRPQAATQLQN